MTYKSPVKSMSPYSERWLRLALFNFVVATLVGLFVRYKLTFPFPVIEFRNLLHAHSHFAFSGWISMALFALLIAAFIPAGQHEQKKYRWLFGLSQFTSYGMLFSFLVQEYGAISIAFSTAYIFVTYGFTFSLWQQTRREKYRTSVKALRAALVFLCISSLGPFTLAYIKATNIISSELYHNAVYWYLHFQYNGWFSFAVFALFLAMRDGSTGADAYRLPFGLMVWACFPAYLLSVLWIIPPHLVFIVAGLSATVQFVALCLVIVHMMHDRKMLNHEWGRIIHALFILSVVAFSIKIVLQLLSVFTELNHFVFGHRPVIIGYLHLVMLGFVSFFIIGLSIYRGLLGADKFTTKLGIWMFISGVLFNEAGLMLQGFTGILYITMNWIPLFLFAASIMMFGGIALFAMSQFSERVRSALLKPREQK